MSLYCEHDRIGDQCEDCAFLAAQQRGFPHLPAQLHTPTPKSPAEERVEEDTLVDVGGDVSVLVMAGDVVPTDVADKPRRPRYGSKSRRK